MTNNHDVETVRSGLRLTLILNMFVLGCLLAALVLVAGATVGQLALVAGVGLVTALTAAMVMWRQDLRQVYEAQQVSGDNSRNKADHGGFGF